MPSRRLSASENVASRPLDSEAWKSIAANLPSSVPRRGLLVRDAAALSTSSKVSKIRGSAFLSNSLVDVTNVKGRVSNISIK